MATGEKLLFSGWSGILGTGGETFWVVRHKGVQKVKGWLMWARGEAGVPPERDAAEGLQSNTDATCPCNSSLMLSLLLRNLIVSNRLFLRSRAGPLPAATLLWGQTCRSSIGTILRPKSISLKHGTSELVSIKMFSTLMSQWKMFFDWSSLAASTSCFTMSLASSSCRDPPFTLMCLRRSTEGTGCSRTRMISWSRS